MLGPSSFCCCTFWSLQVLLARNWYNVGTSYKRISSNCSFLITIIDFLFAIDLFIFSFTFVTINFSQSPEMAEEKESDDFLIEYAKSNRSAVSEGGRLPVGLTELFAVPGL